MMCAQIIDVQFLWFIIYLFSYILSYTLIPLNLIWVLYEGILKTNP